MYLQYCNLLQVNINILFLTHVFCAKSNDNKKKRKIGIFNTLLGIVVLGTHAGIARIISSRIA